MWSDVVDLKRRVFTGAPAAAPATAPAACPATAPTSAGARDESPAPPPNSSKSSEPSGQYLTLSHAALSSADRATPPDALHDDSVGAPAIEDAAVESPQRQPWLWWRDKVVTPLEEESDASDSARADAAEANADLLAEQAGLEASAGGTPVSSSRSHGDHTSTEQESDKQQALGAA